MTLFSTLYSARLDEELGTDDSTSLFTSGRRKAAINRGIEQFAELTECFVRWSTIVITSAAAEYDLNVAITATDFTRLARTPIEFHYVDASSNVTILSGQDDLPHRDVKWLDDNEPGWRNSSASSVMQLPQLTYERLDGGARYLGLWPPPSSGSSASMKVLVPYVAKPPVLTSDTSEPFTLNGAVRGDLRWAHQAAVHFGAHQLEKLRRDTEASDKQLQMFLGYVARFAQNTRKKGGNVISQVRSYFTRNRFRNADRGEDVRT